MNDRIVLELYQIGAVKFGSFTLKSGVSSPIYLDLRMIISYPKLLNEISEKLWKMAESLSFDLVCGVPYTALPIATCISVAHDVPMILRRKEVKEYGTKKILEGVYQKGQRCLIVEDVVTSGASILETIDPMHKEGLAVSDVVAIINRQQGGKERLAEHNVKLHALMTISDLLQILQKAGKIDHATLLSVQKALNLPL